MSVIDGVQLGRPSRSPFAATTPAIGAAVPYAIACLVWVLAGERLPGGRWLAVHLFTLGVLTNLVLGFSQHFGRTLTRSDTPPARWLVPAANVGVLLTLGGRVGLGRWSLGLGGTAVTVVVFASYVRLRRMRKAAGEARLLWVVRLYERAHGAFVHGATLGILIGVGALRGGWAGTARLSHLHVNVLGWGGLTVLGTLVFLGPALVRARILPGADERAARALRRGGTGLSVGVLLLLASAVGGAAGTTLRVLAGVGIGVLAWATTVTCGPVLDAARRGVGAARWPVAAATLWFPAAAWVDALVVASGRWRHLDAVGAAVLLGVFAQLLTAVLAHVAPLLRPRDDHARDRVRGRVDAGAVARAAVFNAGVAAVVVAAALRSSAPDWVAPAGWLAVTAAVAWLGVACVSPAGLPRRRA